MMFDAYPGVEVLPSLRELKIFSTKVKKVRPTGPQYRSQQNTRSDSL